ncbi:hypothetical protein QR680_008272 [Steinernema hermaphroditum]|uniref:Sphingomyelin phosphodiesterase n=1 Tax=Steinernema hermaphroditum TaxID=289476 RepID=A0AA39M7C7_9BILA|nr:hypothetical protein QR680_008272 [Steinernema hermaphroditum]
MRLWIAVPLLAAFLVVAAGVPPEENVPEAPLGNSVVCRSCTLAVKGFQFIYGRKFTQDQLMNLLVFICKTFAHTDSSVCKAMGGQFREELIYVIRELIFEPRQLCGLITSDCGESYNPFQANWSIPLPPIPKHPIAETIYPTTAPKTLRVLQISDLHFDMKYTPGAEADCGLPICCQHVPEGQAKSPAGFWGIIAACDLPHWTIENMFQHLNETSDDFDYVLLSGDYMSHNDWSYTRAEHKSVIEKLAWLFQLYLPEKPVFWAIGNHEGVPVNSFAPHFAPERFQPTWLYKSVSRANRLWLNSQAQSDMEYRGSYSIRVGQKLRLISLNTGYCENTNFWLYINQTDPDGTMSWFVNQLGQAEAAGESVHVMAHVPPGDAECLEGWAFNYYRVINRFAHTITAQFFGHVHTDSFTVFYENMNDPSSTPTGVHYTAPSVTTYEGLNPAYRIYTIEGEFEGSRYRVLDFDNYFLNLTNLKSEADTPKWEKLYSARSEYNMNDLSAQSWNELITQIGTNPEVFSRFLKNYSRREGFPCDKKCREELLCSLRRGHHNEAALCPEVTSSLESQIGKHVLYRPNPTIDPSFGDQITRSSFLDDVKSKALKKIISLFSRA